MKRLTERYEENGVQIKDAGQYPPLVGETLVCHRLADIEDILGDEYEIEQVQSIFDEWHHYLKFASERNAIEGAVDDMYENGNIDWERLRELVEADREGRCVILPCEPGHEISYKSSIGLRCNAVIDEYTPANIFITAKTEIPNAEPLIQTFSILEVEDALKAREQE